MTQRPGADFPFLRPSKRFTKRSAAGRCRCLPSWRAYHVWTAERIFPGLADEYRRLRALLGKPAPPLNVIVSGSGRIDLGLPVFASGEAPALIVTTAAGAKRLRKQRAPVSVGIRAVRRSATRGSASTIRSRSILEQVGRRFQVGAGKLILDLRRGGSHLFLRYSFP